MADSTPAFTRPALAPGLLAAVVLAAGSFLLASEAHYWVLVVTAVLASIMAVFAVQARMWWALALLVVVVVLWNPVWPLTLSGQGWVAAQYLGALGLIVIGVLVKVPRSSEG